MRGRLYSEATLSNHLPFGLDTDAYLADTGHLSTIEHGAYLLLLVAIHRSKDGWLPGDDVYLARATHLTINRWRKIAGIIRKFFIEQDGCISQKRALAEHKIRQRQNCGKDSGLDSGRPSKSLKTLEPDSENAKSDQIDSYLLTSLDSESKKSKEVSKKRAIGTFLPDDWIPRDQERLYGKTVLRLTDRQIDAAAEQMRRWALANAHRPIARKANWNATFANWLDRNMKGDSNEFSGRSRTDGAFAAAGRLVEGIRSGEVILPPRPTLFGPGSSDAGKATAGMLPQRRGG
jgi:uncharacterized protein YdaU (DUF1376 family)